MMVVSDIERFYNGVRQRVGKPFDMDVSKLKKDGEGNPIFPKGVHQVANAQEAEKIGKVAKEKEAKRFAAGATAASGGQAAKQKNDAGRNLMG